MSADTDVTVKFSEAMDAATVNGSTVELLEDPSGPQVPATVSYDAASFTATLNPDDPLSAGVTYRARVRGGSTDPRVKDVAGNALAGDVTWTFTIVKPPEVVSTTPAPGSTNESIGVAPAARFSEALDPATVDETTVLLTDADTPPNPVPVAVFYDADNFTVTLTPLQLLQRGQTYTVTLKGGPDEPHITDATGTPLAADFVLSFTTAFSIFAPGDTPAIFLADDPDAESLGVELGLKFRSDIEGLITGVRFFKGGPENGGQHVGHLWRISGMSGTLLGSATFNNETPSGWQQALFETPIPILANTTYVISYFAPQGKYSATRRQFQVEKENPPLRALSNAEAGGNGVFRYGGGFPDSPFDSTYHWVDVVFNNSGPLRVLTTTPLPGATNVPTGIAPAATFSKSLDPNSLVASTEDASTVLLRDAAGILVPVDVSYNASAFTVTLTPQQPLQPGQTYTVTLKGGPDEPHITDATGTPLAADFVWSFTTESPPAMPQVTMLSDWVTAGANFIAMRPDKRLASLLGLNYASSVLSNAYLLVNTAQGPGAGIVNQTIQYQGATDLYTIAGAAPFVAGLGAANGNALATFAP